jgi:hypothetical protein
VGEKKTTPFKITLLIDNNVQKKRATKLQGPTGTEILIVFEELEKKRGAKKAQ